MVCLPLSMFVRDMLTEMSSFEDVSKRYVN
jgi:hypothetical protein